MNLKNYTKEFKTNIRLATPIILAMLGHTLVGFIDSVMVGKLGTTELAAVSLGNSIIFVAIALGVGFSTSITTLTAEAYGLRNFKKSKSVLKHGLLINTILSVFLFGILLFSEKIMILTGQDPNVIALALPYVNLVGISLVPLMIFQAFKQFTDGFSLTKYSMYVTFIANGINVFFNYIFIYGNFGMPALGVLGAGVGTLISRFLMPVLMWWFLFKKPRLRPYIVNFNWKTISPFVVKKIINLGVPSSLQMIFEAGIFIAATWISGAMGKNYQAANQIALTFSSLTFMISAGMSNVAIIRIGNLKGQNDFFNLRRVALSFILLVVICQVAMALLYAVFSPWIPYVFLDTSNLYSASDIEFVISTATSLLIIAGIFQIPDGIQILALGILRGMQDVKIPMYITFVAYWLIAFPICYYLGLFSPLKASGIWIGLCVGLTAAAILLILRFNWISQKLLLQNQSENKKMA